MKTPADPFVIDPGALPLPSSAMERDSALALDAGQKGSAVVAEAAIQWPFLSVIMPVRNEVRNLSDIVNQLLAQRYPADRFEILIVDGRSTDGTWNLAETLAHRHYNVHALDNPSRLSSGARNVGIRHARGDMIVVVDGHCELEGPEMLSNVAKAFEASGADCLGRPQPLDVAGASPLQRAIAEARSHWLGHHPASLIYSTLEQFVPAKSVAVAYRRAVFEQVGMFDESFDACEDVELNHRVDQAGLRCFFTPKIAVRYRPRTSLSGLFHQMVRYGRGRMRLCSKHPETFSFQGFIPSAFVLGLLIGLGLAVLAPWLAYTYLGVIALYMAVVLATSIAIAARLGQFRLLPWLPAVFATVHVGAGWGILTEFVAFGWHRQDANVPTPKGCEPSR